MAEVSVEINKGKYQISCDNGQEEHVNRLGHYVDNRVKELVAAVGQVGDENLLVMVSLLIADELSEAYAELEVARSSEKGASALMLAEESLSAEIDQLAERIEKIVQGFK